MRGLRARWSGSFERLWSPPASPRLITDGALVTDDAVWAWVVVPAAATYLLEDAELTHATWQVATGLAALLPSGADYHLKVLWSRHRGADYLAGWERVASVRAPGAGDYLELGADRIDRNADEGFYRRRTVLLGVRIEEPNRPGAGLTELARHELRSPAAAYRQARRRLERARPLVDRWCRLAGTSVLQATAAPANVIGWAYARELRRDVELPPAASSSLAGPALVDLLHGQVDPGEDPTYLVVTDAASGRRRYVSILAAAVNGFPPSELAIPGGEWLELLTELPGVEASVRGVNHGQAGSMRLLDEGRKVTRSQAREAGEHGHPVPLELAEADATLEERRQEVQRRQDVLTTQHPRWVVDAATPAELADRVAGLRQRYTGVVRLAVVPHVQGLLWRELLPGDRVRVPEFAQFQPMRTLAGSWFHGGSRIGDDTGPYVGANLGSTPGPVQVHLVSRAEADRARPTSVSFTGASGSGKSTAVMLTVLGALAEGAWVLLVDPKGDLAGIVELAGELLGVPALQVDVMAAEATGMLDPMRFSPTADQARALTLDVLLGTLPAPDRRQGEAVVERAVDAVLAMPREIWSSQRVLTELTTMPLAAPRAEAARELGELLTLRAKQPALRAVLGPLAPEARPLRLGRGLVYLGLAALDLPRHTSDPRHWSVAQRCAMTAFRVAMQYALQASRTVRELKKVVALTELHLITGTDEGRAVVQWLARTGRALQTWLLLDSQAAADLAAVPGLVEQLVMSFAFRAVGRTEQDAQAALLGRPEPGPRLRAAQASLATGQCVLRDRHGRLGLVEFDRLTTRIAAALSTDAAEDTPDLLDEDTATDDSFAESTVGDRL